MVKYDIVRVVLLKFFLNESLTHRLQRKPIMHKIILGIGCMVVRMGKDDDFLPLIIKMTSLFGVSNPYLAGLLENQVHRNACIFNHERNMSHSLVNDNSVVMLHRQA